MGKKHLTPKQEAFVREYLIDLNATQAAIRAGYSAKTANEQGSRLLANVKVKSAIEEAKKKRAERVEITQDYVLGTIRETIERCKQATPVLDRKGKPVLVETSNGDLVPAYVFEPHAIMRGAELLGKHLGILKDKVEHSGSIGSHETALEQLNDDAAREGNTPPPA